MAKTISFPDTPGKAIKTRARNLPLGQCFVTENWDQAKLATVLVSRRHINGNVTVGIYQVDLFCLGVKDSFYKFNIPEEEYLEIIDNKHSNIIKIDYELAHNIIYAGIEFADEFGFKPCREFEITKYILEEDDDNIPIIEVECGMDGKPVVMREKYDKKAGQISKLLKTAGEDNFIVLDVPDEIDEYNDENDDEIDEEDDDIDDFDEAILKDYPDFKEIEEWEIEDFDDFIKGKKEVPEFQNHEIIDKLIITVDLDFDYDIHATEEFQVFNKLEIKHESESGGFEFGSEDERELFEKIIINTVKQEESVLSEIKSAIEKYPDQPMFYNLLSTVEGDEKFQENLHNIHKRFPYHPFTYIILLYYYISHELIHEAKVLLDNRYHLQQIFPTEDYFMENDVIGFYSAISEFYARTDNLKLADIYINLAEEAMDYEPRYAFNQVYEPARIFLSNKKSLLLSESIEKLRLKNKQ